MSKLLSVSLPDDLVEETDALARALGKTRSEVVRDALRRHLRYERFSALQEYGRDTRAAVLEPASVSDQQLRRPRKCGFRSRS